MVDKVRQKSPRLHDTMTEHEEKSSSSSHSASPDPEFFDEFIKIDEQIQSEPKEKTPSPRNMLSALRSVFSPILGSSNTVETRTTSAQKTPSPILDNNVEVSDRASSSLTEETLEDLQHALKDPELLTFEDIAKTFGSGVTLTKEHEKDWMSLLNSLLVPGKNRFLKALQAQLDSGKIEPESIQSMLTEEMEKAKIASWDPRYQTIRSLLFALLEQKDTTIFNSQFKHEFLPKQFMLEEERQDDGELKREKGRLDLLKSHMETLPDSDPRKIRFTQMIKEAESAGFVHGKNLEIAAGDMPGVTVDRLYGVQRTPEGFTSVLGLGQGDRYVVGTDFMPWPHKTTEGQNAAMMKILRAMEKSDNPEKMEGYFETPYKRLGSSLDPAQKEELKKELLQFAQARTKRINEQHRQLTSD